MKKQASIWLVVAFMTLVVGLVYALSTTTPRTAETVPVSDSAGAPIAQTAAAPKESVSLSPNLAQTDAFEFLDPIPVGKAAPAFTGSTAGGKPIRLADYKGKKNLVLIFYQGSFCTVCAAQLSNFQSHLSDFRNQDAEIIAISADDAQHARQSVGEHGLTFNVVPDQNKKIIQQFGVANVSKHNIAWPSLFVVDKKGIVRLSYADREGHRLHSNEVLPALSKITGKPVPTNLTYDN